MRLVRAFVAAALVVLTITPAAVLAQGLEMTTDFPAVVADPGATVRFPVTVTTDTPERVDLTVVEQPEGWDTSLRGEGSTISAVTTGSNPEVPGEISADVHRRGDRSRGRRAGSSQVVIEGSRRHRQHHAHRARHHHRRAAARIGDHGRRLPQPARRHHFHLPLRSDADQQHEHATDVQP